jgi:hypothetical protein
MLRLISSNSKNHRLSSQRWLTNAVLYEIETLFFTLHYSLYVDVGAVEEDLLVDQLRYFSMHSAVLGATCTVIKWSRSELQPA